MVFHFVIIFLYKHSYYSLAKDRSKARNKLHQKTNYLASTLHGSKPYTYPSNGSRADTIKDRYTYLPSTMVHDQLRSSSRKADSNSLKCRNNHLNNASFENTFSGK